MSYQEKRALVFLMTNILTLGLYILFVFHRYHDVILMTPNDFKFWGKMILILIPVSIVSCIVIFILFRIINKILTKEEMPIIMDERDKLIELRASRVSHWISILGFFLSMGSQVIGMQPYVMFITLVASGFVAACVAEIIKFYLYRKGF